MSSFSPRALATKKRSRNLSIKTKDAVNVAGKHSAGDSGWRIGWASLPALLALAAAGQWLLAPSAEFAELGDAQRAWQLLWVIGLALALGSAVWSPLGPLAYVLVTYWPARYTPGQAATLAAAAPSWVAAVALAAMGARMAWDRRWPPRAGRWFVVLLVVLAAWVAITTGRAMAGDPAWPPPLWRHPIAYFDGLCLGLLAVWNRDSRIVAWMGVGLALACVERGGLFPERLSRDGDIGLLLAMAAPLLLIPLVMGPGVPWRLVGAALTGVTLWMLYETRNRGAAVGLAAAAPVLWLATPRRWLVLAVAAPVLMAGGLFLANSEYAERFAEVTRGEGEGFFTAFQRLELWDAGMAMFRDHPLFGVGPGLFHAHLGPYVRDKNLEGYAAHNNLMAMATETGFPGVTLWLALFGGALAIGVRQRAVRGTGYSGWTAGCLCASLAAYLAAGMFITRQDMALAYWLAGSLAALPAATGGEESDNATPNETAPAA